MNKKVLTAIGIIVLAVVSALGVSFLRPASTNTVVQSLGSVSGPDLSSPYFTVNGLQRWFYRKALSVATTTPCAFQAPNATSSMYTTFQVTTSTSTTVTLNLATSTTAFATTTPINTFSIASGATASFNQPATTTAASIMAPNTWIVWGATGFIPNSVDQTKFLGTCSAIFTVL